MQKDGSLEISASRLMQWQTELLKLDPDAKFKDDAKTYWDSGCEGWYQAKQAYDLTRPCEHFKTCTKKKKNNGTGILSFFSHSKDQTKTVLKPKDGMKYVFLSHLLFHNRQCSYYLPRSTGQLSTSTMSSPKLSKATAPCPGLSADIDPRIGQYLERTGVGGGGGVSIPDLAKRGSIECFEI